MHGTVEIKDAPTLNGPFRRQIDITTYQLLFFLSDTSLCLFGDDLLKAQCTMISTSIRNIKFVQKINLAAKYYATARGIWKYGIIFGKGTTFLRSILNQFNPKLRLKRVVRLCICKKFKSQILYSSIQDLWSYSLLGYLPIQNKVSVTL